MTIALGQYEEAQKYMHQALTLAHQFGSIYHVGRYNMFLSQLYNKMGQAEEGLTAAQQAISKGGEVSNKRIMGQGHIYAGQALLMLGRLQEAQATLLVGLALVQDAAVREMEVEAHQLLYQGLRRARRFRRRATPLPPAYCSERVVGGGEAQHLGNGDADAL
ncbi:MAG: hypothetical protein IPL28_25320 [Chloroflexi bacterium]|nr:hypothetical protein [Chloroflexota bacterium]